MAGLSLFFTSHSDQICRNHLLHHGIKAGFVPPAQSLTGLGGVAEQKVNLSRAEIPRIDLN
jgi:hypothetical protein